MQIDGKYRALDYCRLSNADEYQRYFVHLNRAFAFLRTWYRKLASGGDMEAKTVEGFLERLLYTVQMLRLKHLYSPTDHLTLDLNDSGLPHAIGICELASDKELREERLKALPSRRIIEELMLEAMLTSGRDPVEMLSQMAKRHFVESFDLNLSFQQFTPGEIKIVGKNGDLLTCTATWAVYDMDLNVPYVHVMGFDYHGKESALERAITEGVITWALKKYGNRGTTPLIVLATSIDEELTQVSPKIIKRIKIGPITCPLYIPSERQDQLSEWIKTHGEVDDFALSIESEMIYSKAEVREERGWFDFSRRKLVKQIFAIPSTGQVSGDRFVSQFQPLLILPHQLLQQVGNDEKFKTMFGRHQHVTYTEEGEMYGIT